MVDKAVLQRSIPFAIYIAFIAVADGLARCGWSADELRWLYPLKVGAVAVALGVAWGDYTELRWTALGCRGWVAAPAVGVLVLILWLLLGHDWMVVGTADGFDPRTGGMLDWRLVVVRLVGGALVVPVMEELFWRSFLMRWITHPDFLRVDPRMVGVGGFLTTMLLFGVEHNQWLAGMVAGAAYGALYMWRRQLWGAIVAHSVTNGLLGGWIISTGQWTYW